jgi:Sigma-70 region 2
MKRTNRDASVPESCRAAPAHAHTGDGNQDGGVTEKPTAAPSPGRERGRPLRPELDRAAVDLIRRRGPEILGTARRYAANLDAADDAYQRGLEILLRKAPSTREEDLVPWMKTVVIRTIGPTRLSAALLRTALRGFRRFGPPCRVSGVASAGCPQLG